MDTKIFNLPIVLLALSLPTCALAQTSSKVKTIGVRVIHKVDGDEDQKLVPFTTFHTGTSVALLVESAAKTIIKVDNDNSKVDSFKDDQGNDLMGKRNHRDGIGSFPRISEDGKLAMVEINADGVPNQKAGKIKIEGTIALQLASKKTKIKSPPFEMEKGTVIKVGDIEMTLKRIGKRSFGEEGAELNFQTNNKEITLVANAKFYDTSGTEIKSETGSSSRMGIGNRMTYGREYELLKPVTGKVTMEFEIWTDMVVEKVPFNITTGVGG